ncbi:hypothetical protein ACTVH1_03675 [Gluconobacter cerinus]
MRANNTNTEKQKKTSQPCLDESLDLISQATKAIRPKYRQEQSQGDQNESKDVWDRAHKSSSLATQLNQWRIQKRGLWFQSLALFLSAIATVLGSYSAFLATIQSGTAVKALNEASRSASTASAVLALTRKYDEAIFEPKFDITLPDEIKFDPNSNNNRLRIDVRNIGSNSIRSPGFVIVDGAIEAYSESSIKDTIKKYISFNKEKVIFSPNETHTTYREMFNSAWSNINKGKKTFILVAVPTIGPFSKNYIRYKCIDYIFDGEKFTPADMCPQFNDLDEQEN